MVIFKAFSLKHSRNYTDKKIHSVSCGLQTDDGFDCLQVCEHSLNILQIRMVWRENKKACFFFFFLLRVLLT